MKLLLLKILSAEIKNIPNVLESPKPQVEILNFNEYGTLLAVRPFCTNEHYMRVYFDVNQAIGTVTAALTSFATIYVLLTR